MSLHNEITNVTALIVSLNKEPCQSLTFNSLRNCELGKELNVVFWSNKYSGPDRSDRFTKHICCKKNENLSYVYNTVIESEKIYSKQIILDDDTVINDEYIKAMLKTEGEIIIPEVYVSGDKVYPISISSNFVVSNDVNESLKSINSGICLSRKAIEKLKKTYGNVFDDRFCFYGTDFSFFYRIDKLGIRLTQSGKITHNLSRLNEKYKVNEFRWRQKVYENILMWRNYPEYNSRIIIFKVFAKLVLYFQYSTFRSAMKVLFNNKASINE